MSALYGERAHATGLAFGMALATTLLVALLQSAKPFYYDSGVYWSLGETFDFHGHFSLLNFSSPLRGYLFPLFDHALRGLTQSLSLSPSVAVKVVNALMLSAVGTVLAPRLAELAWPSHSWGATRRLLLTGLLLAFWHGFLDFPLSDIPALVAALVALAAAARPRLGWVLLSGAACATAVDIRPSYVLLAPAALSLVVWGRVARSPSPGRAPVLGRIWRHGRSLSPLIALFAIGFTAVSLPQSLASHRHYRTWSFIPGSAAHLTNLQLREGLLLQRYETFVGTGHAPQMEYIDPEGQALLSRQPHGEVDSVSRYLALIASHPIAMSGVFMRHLVNGMDQRYTTPYVTHLDTGSHRWLRLAGLTLFFAALLRMLWPAARRALAPARWRWPVALALSTLTAIPSAIETRYLIALYLLSYVMVLAPGWPSPIGRRSEGLRRYRRLALIACSYSIFMAGAWHAVSGANHHLVFG